MSENPRLNEIQARLDAATPGPWEIIGGNEYLTGLDVAIGSWDEGGIRLQDAEFIAAAPVDVARLTRAVEAVLELHVPVMEDGEPAGCSCCDWESEGNWGWPCATLAAIENALQP